MPELRLYNTLTRKKEVFTPLDAKHVRMYVCGPTVYDFAHIGNARPVIVFDVLFRLLRHLYGERHVIYTRNITDVDDKINARAARDYPDLPINEAIRRVTEATADQFQADVEALCCLPPTHQPRATEHIEGMVAIINKLLTKGYAYLAEGAEGQEVLFAVEKMPRYGQLSNRKLADQAAGARVAVEAHKRHPGDFVLWKQSAADEPGWNADFNGVSIYGRPGWHIECSAMSMAKLLEPFGGGLTCDDPAKNTFDIHAGGLDLIFPHHENEIAQSCCAFGNERMANIWMHNGFLQVEGQKMSKSLGNFRTIREVLKDWPGEVARLTMLKTHYRQPIDWTAKSLEESAQELLRYAEIIETIAPDVPTRGASSALLAPLMDDLNTARMVAALRDHAREATSAANAAIQGAHHNAARLLRDDLALLGFDLTGFAAKMAAHKTEKNVETAQIDTLITARLAARAAKDWAEADRLRAALEALGIQLKDGKDETGNPITTWEVKR